MQNREFEKQVQDKMEGLKLTPADAVWEKVEAGLPEEKKRRRWLIFVLCFMFLITASLLVWNSLNRGDKTSVQQLAIKEDSNKVASAQDKNIQNEPNDATANLLQKEKPGTEVTSATKKNIHVKGSTKIKIKNGSADLITATGEENIATANNKKKNTKGTVKVAIKAPVAASDTDEYTSAMVMPADSAGAVNNHNNIVAADTMVAKIKQAVTDSLVVKNDTAKKATKENKKAKRAASWQYGVDFAAGSSAVSNNLFNNKSVYADASAIFASPGSGGGQSVSTPNQPSANKVIVFGFYAEKDIALKWKFRTGLNYLYQSNWIKTGDKVDSAVNLNSTLYGSFTSSSYYRSGSSTAYTNRFHLLEVPLVLQFKNSQRSPVYLEAGPSLAWLLSSNALIYNSSTSSYITNKNLFNKLIVSFTAGAGFDIAKRSKLPMSIGYQFKYSLNSAVKPEFAKQHFINSMIYVKIPLKK